MSADFLISVIVPAYNHEKYVEDALRSLMAQSYRHLELIVIDDGSTDSTFDRIRHLKPELEQRFTRVETSTKDHEGSAKTITRCLELARGELAYMLDSDDVAHSDAIGRLKRLMESPQTALAVGDNEFIDAESRSLVLTVGTERRTTMLEYHTAGRPGFSRERDFGSYASLILGNYVPNGWLMRPACIAAVGGYTFGLMLDDWTLLLKLAKKYRIAFAGSVLAKYRLHGGNVTAVHEQKINLDTAIVLLQERPYCLEHGYEREWWLYAREVYSSLNPEHREFFISNFMEGEHPRNAGYSRFTDVTLREKLIAPSCPPC
ncbi:glycosyltransferase family 2 protein [bacterium]|nr:glycosyltransferase family 2 protein [bacterium]